MAMLGPLRPDPRIFRWQLQLCRGDHKRPKKKSKNKFNINHLQVLVNLDSCSPVSLVVTQLIL
ncbi:hypothetical protein NC652_023669 [Populus alba x Populus x berolinensis]|nr:hypothetical protein NC652_023669 [Populus alba x Populus x berolinensis]